MPLPAGTTLGPYEIVTLLGSGGMGEVYRARDRRLNRDVAIKVLPESFAKDPDRLLRFEQEARSVAGLNHPNILAIYDVGQHQGAPYLVTELLEGQNLRFNLREGRSERKNIEQAIQIAHGLAAAHEKGIVHRDLKPENVFVTRAARIKILDFGLAKLAQPEGASSADWANASTVTTGIAVGTPAYMSPEQLRGLDVDARSDIFSFGLVLCEMFSGRHPFQRQTSFETMNAILNADPFAEKGAEAVLPRGVQLIVSHCLEKNPHDRFQSALDIAFSLDTLSGASGSATAVRTSGSSPSRWWLRSRLALEAILLLLLIVAIWQWPSSPKPIVSTAPNAFLVAMTQGLKPGRSLDVGMGQGRNTIYLAQQGWDSVGFDQADEAVAAARQHAKKLGVTITTSVTRAEEFDWGEAKWDLILLSYVDAREYVTKVVRALRAGGMVVVEGFHRDVTKGRPMDRGIVFDTNELPRLFSDLRVVRYEDTTGTGDVGLADARVVRLAAVKP